MDEVNKTNPGQQPEQPDQLKTVQEQVQKFKELGINVNLLFDMMAGVAENVVKKSTQELSGLVDQKIGILAQNLGKQLEERQKGIEGQLNQVIEALKSGPAPASGMSMVPAELPPGPGVMQQGGGSNPMAMFQSIAPILKMLGLGGGESAGGMGGFDAMIQYANKIAEFNRAIQAPQLEALTTMRQSVLQDLTALSKTGGTLPWEREDEPAVKVNQPSASVAKFNQPKAKPDYKEIAISLSRSMKIVP